MNFKYRRHYFDIHILPKNKEVSIHSLNDHIATYYLHQLFEGIGFVSHSDASKMFDTFAKMDVDGSENISCVEFHRYFGWKCGVFTERIFDSYLVPQDGSNNHWTENKDGLSFVQF
jgi:hypothetical protein